MQVLLDATAMLRASFPSFLDSWLFNRCVCWFADGSRSSKYLFKADSAGGWSRAAKVGFLVSKVTNIIHD